MANQANIKAVITAEDRASGVLKGFSSKIDGIASSIVSAAKGAALALGAGAVAATTFAVKSAASFEQTRIGLENMLGSADQARKLLKDISKFAADTPFEFPELAESAKQLVAFGFSAEDAFKTMKQLGNVSAAVGAPINDLAYLMGTLRTQGRAFAIDIRQFAQRGIPIYEQLAKVLKVNQATISEMITEGKIGFPEVQKAFEDLAGEGGKWGKTMERQSKSLNGLWSTFKDTIGQTARELVGITQEGDIKEGSLFDRLSTAVDALNRNLPSFIENTKRAVQVVLGVGREVVDYIAPGFQNFSNTLEHLAKMVQDTVMPSLTAWYETIRDRLWPQIKELWNAIEPGFTTALKVVASILGGLFMGALWLSINAANFFATVLGGVIRVINDVIKWIGNAAVVIGRFAQDVYGFFSKGWGKDLVNVIIWPFKTAFNEIARLWNATVGKIDFKAPDWVPGIGGKGWSIPKIPLMAEGGIVTKPTLVMAGEAGSEAIVPLNKAGGVGGQVNITIQAGAFMGTDIEARKFAKVIWQHLQDMKGMKNQMGVL